MLEKATFCCNAAKVYKKVYFQGYIYIYVSDGYILACPIFWKKNWNHIVCPHKFCSKLDVWWKNCVKIVLFRSPSKPLNIRYISYFLNIVQNPEISAMLWKYGYILKCYTFLESAHYVESDDNHIASKKNSRIIGFKWGVLRELRKLKTLNGKLGDLNNKKFSWFFCWPPFIDPLQNL